MGKSTDPSSSIKVCTPTNSDWQGTSWGPPAQAAPLHSSPHLEVPRFLWHARLGARSTGIAGPKLGTRKARRRRRCPTPRRRARVRATPPRTPAIRAAPHPPLPPRPHPRPRQLGAARLRRRQARPIRSGSPEHPHPKTFGLASSPARDPLHPRSHSRGPSSPLFTPSTDLPQRIAPRLSQDRRTAPRGAGGKWPPLLGKGGEHSRASKVNANTAC